MSPGIPWRDLGAPPPAAVAVAESADRPLLGQFLQATRPLKAGDLLVQERYLCLVSVTAGREAGARHAELYRAVAQGRGPGGEGSVWGRWGAGLAEIRAAGLHPGDEALAAKVRHELQEAALGPEAEGLLEEMVYLACIFSVNSFSFPGEGGRRNDVVFPSICRANHSCSPNAVIMPGMMGESRLVAVRDIGAGEAVEICYLTSDYLMKSTRRRREVLEERFHFECHCDRCDAATDTARRFCVDEGLDFTVSCDGHVCCHASKAALEDGAVASALLCEEKAVEDLLATLPEPEDLALPANDTLSVLREEDLQRCLRFAAKHDRHYVSAEIARRRAPSLHEEGKAAEAAAAQEALVSRALELLPQGTTGLAWLVELHARLALLEELAGQRQKALSALREVVRHLSLASSGPPSPGVLFDLMPESREWIQLLLELGPRLAA